MGLSGSLIHISILRDSHKVITQFLSLLQIRGPEFDPQSSHEKRVWWHMLVSLAMGMWEQGGSIGSRAKLPALICEVQVPVRE